MSPKTKEIIMQAAVIAVLLTLIYIAFVNKVHSAPQIYNPATGKYLGNLNNNKYDPNSVANPYGQYGSKYSPDSINNPYGQYGSKYSNDSPNNPYGSNAPVIINNDD